jgi:CRP/FNR family transcriptional regulator, cyclic AMP receptor protein
VGKSEWAKAIGVSMSYEKDIMDKLSKGETSPDRLDISILKYMWDSSPLSFKESYHDFFKKISVLNSFSDNELRLFTKFLHRREFTANEIIFKQGDSGYGFYFIYSGSVNIYSNHTAQFNEQGDFVIRLEKHQYFGEMGLLEEFNRRSATTIAGENTVLLGIFKPDLERMLVTHPVMGAKFLRETALIMANRMGQLTREIIVIKKKLQELEQRV